MYVIPDENVVTYGCALVLIDTEATDDEGICSTDGVDRDPAFTDAGDACMRHVSSDVFQKVEEREERTGDVCSGDGKRDHIIILNTGLFTRLYT